MWKPQAFIVDVDGVMTDGKFYYSEQGKVFKVFGADDHDGLSLLTPYLAVHFVTGDKRGYPVTKARVVDDMHMPLDLVSTIRRVDWIKERWNPKDVVYMGDGIFDHYVFRQIGYSIAPANADQFAKSCAHYVTNRCGGDRAVAEASLHLLEKFFQPYDRDSQPSAQLKIGGQWAD